MKTLGIIVVILVILAAVWFWFANQQESGLEPVGESASVPPPPAVGEAGKLMVEMRASGFSPQELKVKVGDTVDFVNKDSKPHWPASAVHPVHQCYPGFDALKAVQPGESYSFRFAMAKTCKFHDHMNPSLTGSLIVE